MPGPGPQNSIKKLRAALVWPHPRWDRIRPRLTNPRLLEEMDGLSYLAEHGIEPMVVDSSPRWLNPLARFGSLYSGIDLARFFRLLSRYRTFDVVISGDSPSVFLFILLKRILGLRKPVIIFDPALTPEYRPRMRMHAMVLPYAEEVIVFGEIQKQYFEKEYGGRIRIRFMRHRIDADFFNPARADSPGTGARTVVSVGNDVGRDFGCLLKAAESVPAEVLLHTRRLAGAKLPANVTLQSKWISPEELRGLYASAGLVVVPLHHTLHPSGINSLLEAMSMAKAVVVSESPGVTDYVKHGETAWVVPPEDPRALSEGISTLLNDPALRERLGRNARRFCVENCAMQVYAASIAASMRRLTEG